MEGLLDHAGFEIVERYVHPDCSPMTPESRFIVYVCAGMQLFDYGF